MQPRTIAKSAREWHWGWTLAGKETVEEQDKLAEMHREAVAFCSDVLTGQQPRWLFLCGKSGTGKSHLASRIAAFLARWGEWAYNKHGDPVKGPIDDADPIKSYSCAQQTGIMVKWAQIIDAARDGNYAPYKAASEDWFKVIDDVGAEGFGGEGKPTAFVVNQLGKLCDARMGRWTVFTSNFNRHAFATLFDVRVASRMMREGNVIVDTGELRDFNLRAK